MINSYKTIYDVVVGSMGRDGLYIDVSRLQEAAGLSLSTVYAAVKYFEDNNVFVIKRFRGSLLFLKDLSSLDHFDLNGKTFYQACVRRDVKRLDNGYNDYKNEPMMELSFGIEG